MTVFKISLLNLPVTSNHVSAASDAKRHVRPEFRYGSILNQARPHIASMRSPLQRAMMRFSFEHVLPNYGLLKVGGIFLRLWQKLKLGRLLAWFAVPTPAHDRAAENDELINPARKFFYRLHVWESFMPRVPKFKSVVGGRDSEFANPINSAMVAPSATLSITSNSASVASSTTVSPAPGSSSPIAVATATDLEEPVQLFTGCVMDVFYNHVNRACSRLIKRQGREVQVPLQGCCGALAMHAGEVDIARSLAASEYRVPGENQWTDRGDCCRLWCHAQRVS